MDRLIFIRRLGFKLNNMKQSIEFSEQEQSLITNILIKEVERIDSRLSESKGKTLGRKLDRSTKKIALDIIRKIETT